MEPVEIGLLGLGTVGSGVARLLAESSPRIARRAGRPIVVRRALVREPARRRSVPLAAERITDDPAQIIGDPRISVVVELVGGTDEARRLVLDSLAAGKHVVTANKALLAEHGPEIAATARQHGRAVAFEASVGGGIPIIQALTVGLAANAIQAVSAILNGTCNFILTQMTEGGLSYADALAEAKRLGYAEPDPKLDVDGTDTAHKLAVLSQVAFGAVVRLADIPREGIDRLQSADIRYATELGYRVKLLAHARATEAGLELRVAPRLVRVGTPLAEVHGAYNAIRVVGDAVGDTLFHGRGAGAMPTASAVVADLIDVVVGRAERTARTAGFWAPDAPSVPLAAPESISSRYYLRFQIADRPGVLGAIARVLGDHGVSIASVIQHDPGDEATETPVPLVIMTHAAVESRMTAAVVEIDRLPTVAPPSVCLGVEESL